MKTKTAAALLCLLLPALLTGCLTSSSGSRDGKDEHHEATPKARDEYPSYRVVVGYVASWTGNVADIDMSRLTHVNYAFHLSTADGGIAPSGWVLHDSTGRAKWSEPGETDDMRLHALVERGAKEGVKVLLAVGGASDKNFSKFVLDSAKREHFYSEIKRCVNQYKLSGIDIDWEYPADEKEGEAFTALMKGIRRTLDGIDSSLLLTAAVGASSYGAANTTYEGVMTCDWINVMTYDYTGGWSSSAIGSTAPMTFVRSGTKYWYGRGVPYARMALGVPFYGVRFTKIAGNKAGAQQIAFRSVAEIFDVNRSLVADSIVFLADTATVNPADTTKDGKVYAPADTIWSYYWDSPEFIAEKVDFAMKNKMRGMMIWEISQDLQVDSLSLLKAMWDRIIKLGKGPELDKPEVTNGKAYTATLADLRASLPLR